MPKPRLRAKFFCDSSGCIIEKAPPLTFAERKAVFERDGYHCTKCGVKVVIFRLHAMKRRFDTVRHGAVDHIVARSRGGQNNPENLQLLCWGCNSSKGAKDDS